MTTTDPRLDTVLATVRRLLPEFLSRRDEFGEQPSYNWLIDQVGRCHPYAVGYYICEIAEVVGEALEGVRQ